MPTLRQFLATSARRASSFFAAMYAPLSGLQSFIALVRNQSGSLRADFGVNCEYIEEAWLLWARQAVNFECHKDSIEHQEILSEYGKLFHIELPALLNRMDLALVANVKLSGCAAVGAVPLE